MGLFSFLKDTGSNLFGGGQKDADPEAKQKSLQNVINELDLGLQNTKIQVDGDNVKISGQAESQADREKAILAVGNVNGVASVEDNIEVKNAQPQAEFYQVKSGDSLSKIAQQFYGDAQKYPVIFEANKPMLKDPNKIYPGQQLRIPPAE